MRTPIAPIRSLSRTAAGSRVIRTVEGDQVAAVAVVPMTEDPEADEIAAPRLLTESGHTGGAEPDADQDQQ